MGHVVRRLPALLLAFACWVTPRAAYAYEDQFGLSVDATYGRFVPDARRPDGLLLGVNGSLGLDDTWTARVRLAYGAHFATDLAPEALQVGLASAELLYLFDILEWVPYFGFGLDTVSFYDSEGLGVEAGGHVLVGLDWLATRELVIGADIRALTLVSYWEQRPFYLAFSLSVGWLFPL